MPVVLLALPAVIGTGARWVLAGLAAGLSAGAGAELKDFAVRKGRAYFMEKGQEFLETAAADMGLELSESGRLTDETITRVINEKLLAGSGVQIDSLLDKDRLRAGLERQAVDRLCAEVGLPAGAASSLGGVRAALQQWAVGEVSQQLALQAGPIFDGATPAPGVQKIIAGAVKHEGWNVATDMTEKGIDNRLRQAKYRARHKKTWVKK